MSDDRYFARIGELMPQPDLLVPTGASATFQRWSAEAAAGDYTPIDLAVVRYISRRVAELYCGEIIEDGDVERVTSLLEHPDTQRLLLAAPSPTPTLNTGNASRCSWRKRR